MARLAWHCLHGVSCLLTDHGRIGGCGGGKSLASLFWGTSPGRRGCRASCPVLELAARRRLHPQPGRPRHKCLILLTSSATSRPFWVVKKRQLAVFEAKPLVGWGFHLKNSISEMTSGRPEVIPGHPPVVPGHPKATAGHPPVMAGHPGIVAGCSEVIGGHSPANAGHPETVGERPGLTGERPETAAGDPETGDRMV